MDFKVYQNLGLTHNFSDFILLAPSKSSKPRSNIVLITERNLMIDLTVNNYSIDNYNTVQP